MMKTLYAFVCSLAVSLLLISGEVVATEKVQAESVDKIKVLVWGDSLSAAYGIPVDKGWVSLLQEQYKDELDIVNGSISGETTQGGLSRLGKFAADDRDVARGRRKSGAIRDPYSVELRLHLHSKVRESLRGSC